MVVELKKSSTPDRESDISDLDALDHKLRAAGCVSCGKFPVCMYVRDVKEVLETLHYRNPVQKGWAFTPIKELEDRDEKTIDFYPINPLHLSLICGEYQVLTPEPVNGGL